MLHEQLPLKKLCFSKGALKRDQQKGSVNATNFESRINNWMINYISRSSSQGGFMLEVARDAPMTSPLRHLVKAKIACVVEEGVQATKGHSGKSIIGRGSRPTSNSPVHCGMNTQGSAGRLQNESDEEDSMFNFRESPRKAKQATHKEATSKEDQDEAQGTAQAQPMEKNRQGVYENTI